MLNWEHRVEAQRAQRSIFNNIKECKDFDAIQQNIQKWAHGAPPGDRCKFVVQDTHPRSALNTERSVGNVAKTTTPRQYAGLCGDSKPPNGPRC